MRLANNKVLMDISDSIVKKKAELQARGVNIPLESTSELETKYNAPAIKTGRMVLCLDSPEKNGELIPVFIVNGKRVSVSPLHMVRNGSGRYEVWVDNEKYTDITLLPHPQFYDTTASGGVPMYKVAVIVGHGHMRSVVNQRCYYHQIGKPCQFCAVQHWWDANMEKAISEIAFLTALFVTLRAFSWLLFLFVFDGSCYSSYSQSGSSGCLRSQRGRRLWTMGICSKL